MTIRYPSSVGVRLSMLVMAVLLASAACADDGGSSSSVGATSTSGTTSHSSAPVPTGQQAAELQARAMARAWFWRESEASPNPVCMQEPGVSDELRAAIGAVFPMEVEYFEDYADINLKTGLYQCTVVTPMSVQVIRADVVGVDVWLVRGPVAGIGATYLFRWDGSLWVDTWPWETGVTVTSVVS